METVIIILSWVVSILLVGLLLSMPVDKILEKLIGSWKGSKGQDAYHKVELGALGVLAAALIVLVVLMVGSFNV